MPIAQVYLVEGRDDVTKRAVIDKVTAAIAEALGADPQAVRVLIHDVPGSAWGRGGTPMSEIKAGNEASGNKTS